MNNYLFRLTASALFAGCLASSGFAADHGDAPFTAGATPSADSGDAFLFLDPNDNTRLVTAMTLQGFIPPGEAVNFSVFDPRLKYEFELETTGDARPDRLIVIRFSPKITSGATPQRATILLPGGRSFTAPTTVSDLSDTSPTPVVTPGPGGVEFFAGEVDDTFTFDIPGFARFVASVVDGPPADPTQLQRGRDTFAGYNNLAIALRFPVSLLGTVTNNTVGLNATTLTGTGVQLDRSGNPAVNVALIPYPRKNAHNRASTEDDAAGLFADDIVATLTALGTNQAGINLLASLAVTNGDFVRVNLGTPNNGPGGGSNPEAAFPNGRRLGDDVIDTVLAVVTNGVITTGTSTGPNEQPLRNEFPFFPPTHQPFPPETVDDLTRN